MTTKDGAEQDDETNKTAAYLRRQTRSGIWRDPDARDLGIPVGFDGETPTRRISLVDAEARIAELPADERVKIEARFGFGTHRASTPADRQDFVNRLYDATPEPMRLLGWRPPRVSRSATDQLALTTAALLRGATPTPAPDLPEYTRDLYSRAVVLPAGNVGRLTEIHRRIIRSNVVGLDHIVIHQFEHLNTADLPQTQGIGGTTVSTTHVRPDNHNGIAGFRNDLEVRFAPLNPDDAPREIGWIRTRELHKDWLPQDQQFVWSYVPDVPTRAATIQITFASDAPPSAAVRFEDVYEGDQLAPHIPVQVLTIRDRSTQWTWPHPKVGRACGIRVHW